MAMLGYVRCSTDRQMVLQQVDALRAAGCTRIFRDKAVKATARSRPAMLLLRKALRPGDTFAVTAIDRGFRNTREAIAFLDDVLMPIGVTFRSLREHIDTQTPEGRRWYMIEAAEAEYERAKISMRTKEAMAALKRRGQKFGRPRKLTKAKIARVRVAVRERNGQSMERVAQGLQMSRRSLYRALQQA
jgi:DNA invertase Pin-like site-specific DNA recombinase